MSLVVRPCWLGGLCSVQILALELQHSVKLMN